MKAAPDAADFGAMLLRRVGRGAEPAPDIRTRIEGRMGAVAAVLAPDSADAIAEAMGICTAETWPVRVAGAGTRLAADRRPVVVISTSRLNRVTEHEPADLVAGVDAGVSLSSLSAHLRGAGQWLPLDPPDAGGGTVGAALAARAAGALRAGHGTPRDLTLGLEVVTGDGRRLRFGGRVVKNVAGYDAVRLLVGSRGRLGVITHAFVRLRGLPRQDVTLLLPIPDPRAGAELALDVRDRLEVDALELLSSSAGEGGGWTLAVRLTGGDAAVAASTERLLAMAPAARRQESPADFWSALSRAEAGARIHECTTVLPSELHTVLGGLAAAPAAGWRLAVHVTAGVIRAWRDDDGGPSLLPPAATLSSREQDLTRHLCSLFDPAGILQPVAEPR